MFIIDSGLAYMMQLIAGSSEDRGQVENCLLELVLLLKLGLPLMKYG